MPSRWHVGLPGIDPADVRLEHLHAAVSGWLDNSDADHRAGQKPYTVTPAVASPTGAAVEIGLLDDTLTDRLLTRAAPGIRVRLGSAHSTITRPPHQLAAVLWSRLARGGAGATAWCLRFVTPATFRRGNSFTPWPAPRPVLGGLRAAWRAFAPPDLPELVLELSDDPVWVTDVNGANEVVRVNGLVVSGFVGRIRYTCDGPAQTCAAVDRLMRLARFAGIGAYTTRGFGQVRLEPTWQRRH